MTTVPSEARRIIPAAGRAVGDVDDDSDLDVFVANFGGDSRLWLNQRLTGGIFTNGFESGDVGAWSSSSP